MGRIRLAGRFSRNIPSIARTGAALCCCLILTPALHAGGIDESVPTADVIAELEQRASQAKPREQCFLYTELVHTMTEKAGKEIADGETEQAAATLRLVSQYARMIHMNMAQDARRLKDAEILMHHTTYKLGQYLHLVSGDDRVTVQTTLSQLDQVNDELLAQVFQH
jgi:hypothetical protein